MKRGAPWHRKMKRLARRLGIPLPHAVGLVECLLHLTAAQFPTGAVGELDDAEIEEEVGWDGDPGALVEALVAVGWLDRCRCHRLRVHDWPEHADQTVRRGLSTRNQGFAPCYEDASSLLAEDEQEASPPLSVPTPMPEPTPEPEPDPGPPAPPAGSAVSGGSPEPPAPSGRSPPVEDAWTRGLEAAAGYKPTASSWQLTKGRRKALRQLLGEHRSRGSDVFAHVVHGYVFRHRRAGEGFDPMEHFTADTLLRASKRAERLEAFDEATQQHGLSPPFRPLDLRRVDRRDGRGASDQPAAQYDTLQRIRQERRAQIEAAYERGEIAEPTEEAMRDGIKRAARESRERRAAEGPL